MFVIKVTLSSAATFINLKIMISTPTLLFLKSTSHRQTTFNQIVSSVGYFIHCQIIIEHSLKVH